MTRAIRILSLVAVLAAVWAQAAAVHARPSEASKPKISISNVTVKEGTSGATKAIFKVSLSKGNVAEVHFATVDRSATAGSDYQKSSGLLTFREGHLVRRIVVKVFGDPDVELDERFGVTLSKPAGARIADGYALGTIRNDDLATGVPSLSVGDATVTEGDSGTTSSATFNATLSSSSSDTITVDFATAPGSATSAIDFHPTTGTLVFEPGETTKSVTIPVFGDDLVETDETFLVILSTPLGATIANGTGIGTITNDDGGPATSLLLSIGDATVVEGDSGTTSAVFAVTLSPASAGTVTVAFSTSSGSASSAVDFLPATGTLVFNAGETTKSVTVRVQGDTTVETNETFLVILSSASGATIANGTGLGTITNDDGSESLPSISIAAVTVAEGNTGNTAFVFNLTLSAPSSSTVTVDYATADGSAVAPGDYTSVTNTVTFNPGQTSKQAIVQVVGDTVVETNETFTVSLSNPTNATVSGSGSALGTINNDDALPSISIAAVTLAEGNTGNTAFVFNLTLSAPSASTVTVDYATADGSAVAPGDYTSTSGTVTFSPGQTSKQVVVQVKGETLHETNETFSVNLSNASNATIAGSGFALGTINNDDAIPSLSINNVTALEGPPGTTNFVFTVTLSAASGQTVTVDFATANGSAVAPGDYATNSGVLTFNSGTLTQTITIQVVGDAVAEPNETFTVNLSNATNATVSGTGIGTGTITNDD